MSHFDTGNSIAIYSRKSKFTGKGESIENQIELCRQYIKMHMECSSLDIRIFEDEGFSGGNTARPQFQAMMRQARAHQLRAIVCYRLDRISRNISDFAKLIEELEALHVSFYSIKEQFDTSSPLGRAMMYISSIFSQLERETIAERIRDNMHELAKSGRWLGGITPTGYRSIEQILHPSVHGKEKKSFHLELIPEESVIVRSIFDRFLTLGSLTKVETEFLQREIKTKNGKAFSRFTIQNILNNPVYMCADQEAWYFWKKTGVEVYSDQSEFDGQHGLMAYNKTMQKKGSAHQVNNVEDWIVAVGRHPWIVEGKTWVAVHELLERNRSKAYRKPRNHCALLSGKLFCKHCGGYMRPKLSQRENAQGERIFSYLCETKEKSRGQLCCCMNCSGNQADRLVLEYFCNSPHDPKLLSKELKRIKVWLTNHMGEERDENLKKAVSEKKKKIENLVASLARMENSAAAIYITEQINALHKEILDLENAIRQMQLEMTNTVNCIAIEEECDRLLSFHDCFNSLFHEQKIKIIDLLLQRVEWDGNDLELYMREYEKPLCENSK